MAKKQELPLTRYEMSYSTADMGWLVCYAHSMEEAEEMFENGEYVVEEDPHYFADDDEDDEAEMEAYREFVKNSPFFLKN